MKSLTKTFSVITLLYWWLAQRAERLHRQLPTLPEQIEPISLPALSIIVPARNEVANLERLLPTLTNLAYPGEYELIVVDDNSTDGTGKIAKELGARVERVNALPSGWRGKPHACHQGAAAATGQWLLFTDADTCHAPDGPARAVALAHQQGWDGLSLFLSQKTSGWLDHLVLAVAFAGLFAGRRHLNG